MKNQPVSEITKGNLIAGIQRNTLMLTREIADFPVKKFTEQPDEEKWSAAMVAEHLMIVEDMVNKVLEGETAPSERDPGKKVGMIDGAFRNLEVQYPAGDAILPKQKIESPDDLIKEIGKNRKHLQKIILKEEMSALCLDYKHLGFGYMTRHEWVYFVILHCERHLHQIMKLRFGD